MRISDWSSDVCSSDLWGAGSSAGNDYIEIRHSGEEYGGDYGSQIAGDAIATGDDGNANATNLVEFVDDNAGGEHKSGSDTIQAGDGGHFIAGDALATGRNGNATVSNNAGFSHAAAVAIIGSDLITAGDGDDWIAGDAMATDGGRAELITTGDDVSSLSRASPDTINGGSGNDPITGDVLT